MTTTLEWLQQQDHGEVALVAVFDGVDMAYTTTSDTTGIATAWAADDHTSFKTGMKLIGTEHHEVVPFQPDIEVSRIQLKIVDDESNTLWVALTRNELNCTTAETLTATLAPTGTTIGVKNIANFAASGTVYIGHECIAYGSKTTTLNALTRAKFSLHTTDDATDFALRHDIGTAGVYNRTVAPRVTTSPIIWYNRQVAIYLHHKEHGTWSTKANARLLFVGRIKTFGEENGEVTLNLDSIDDVFNTTIMADQFRAELSDKRGLNATYDRKIGVVIRSDQALVEATLSLSSIVTWEEVMNAIQSQFTTWYTAGTTVANWSIGLKNTPDGPRVAVRATRHTGTFPTGPRAEFKCSAQVARILGLYSSSGGNQMTFGLDPLSGSGTTVLEYVADAAPVLSQTDPGDLREGQQFAVMNTSGTWLTQPVIPSRIDQTAEGFIMVGAQIVAVTYDSGTKVFTVKGFLTPHENSSSRVATTATGYSVPAFRITEEATEPPEFKQVWVERDYAANILLRVMLSTGTDEYNHEDYDKYAGGRFGAGIPASLVNIQSFESMGRQMRYQLYIDKPTTMREVIQPLLATGNRYITWKNGQLFLTQPGFESPDVDDIVELTEDNKAQPDDRPAIQFNEEIINRVTLEYGDQINGEKRHVTVEDMASVSEFGQRKSITVKAPGILEKDAFEKYVISPALAYFSRPSAGIRRTYDYSLIDMAPGDMVALTDDHLMGPSTGTRGVSGLACWVRATDWDWERMQGIADLVFMPDHPISKIAKYAPTATIDMTFTSGAFTNGYDSAGVRIKLTSAAYTVGGATDISHFNNGDRVHVVERASLTPATPREWTRSITAIDYVDRVMTLNSALTGYSGSEFYLVEYGAKTDGSMQAAQLTKAFLAADADLSTGYAAKDANTWASASSAEYSVWNGTPSYNQRYHTPYNASANAGLPLSTWKVCELQNNVNNYAGYRSRQHMFNKVMNVAGGSSILGTNLTSYVAQLPAMQLYFSGASSKEPYRRGAVTVTAFLTAAGGATASLKITLSTVLPFGSVFAITWPGGVQSSVTLTSTSSTGEWVQGTVTPVFTGEYNPYCYLVGEMKSSSANFVRCWGLSIVEGALS